MTKDMTTGEQIEHDGTQTKYGWAWKCKQCGSAFIIASDNLVITTCDNCGGELTNLPMDDVNYHPLKEVTCDSAKSPVRDW